MNFAFYMPRCSQLRELQCVDSQEIDRDTFFFLDYKMGYQLHGDWVETTHTLCSSIKK